MGTLHFFLLCVVKCEFAGMAVATSIIKIMNHIEQQAVNISKPDELAYWSKILNVSPGHLLQACKATGSNILNRMIWFLKAEGFLPFHFDIKKSFSQ